MRRLIAAGGLLAAILLAAAPASACPATRDTQSEPGCEVLTLCEMSLQRVDDAPMVHRALDKSGVKVLDPA